MARKHFVTAIVFGLTGVLCFACAEPDWAGGDLGKSKDETQAEGADDDGASADSDDAEQCTPDTKTSVTADGKPGLGLDISTLDACCKEEPGAKAHCVPEDKVASSKDKLSTCEKPGMRCLPDAQINGEVPKSCTSSVTKSEGACVSPCIKSVAEFKSILKADGCGAGLLCAPCVRPGGERSGACELGKGGSSSGASKPAGSSAPKCKAKAETPAKADDGEKTGDDAKPTTTSVSSCCGDKGLCATKELVESRMPGKSDQLEAKECTGGMLCAPKENAAADFKPKTCKGKALTGEYTGVCLSNCIAFSQVQKLASAQGDCDSDHRCLPCKLLGVLSTGAPGCE